MWIDVVIRYASVTEMVVETQCGTSAPNRVSGSQPIAACAGPVAVRLPVVEG